jgi:hypothetical protein
MSLSLSLSLSRVQLGIRVCDESACELCVRQGGGGTSTRSREEPLSQFFISGHARSVDPLTSLFSE